jgi:hypothetical protein
MDSTVLPARARRFVRHYGTKCLARSPHGTTPNRYPSIVAGLCFRADGRKRARDVIVPGQAILIKKNPY